jgi:DNA methyltransferase 1-associated protein 1
LLTAAREIKRKQYASELFHLTAAEIAEEEALYVEIKRLEQNERRYRADRDDLLRTVVGLDSDLVDMDQANIETVLGLVCLVRTIAADEQKKRKRVEDEAPAPVVPKENAAYGKILRRTSLIADAARCITRTPPAIATNGSHLAAKHPLHQPVCLRSSKLPLPRQNAAHRINEVLSELGISTQRLVMPTRGNIEELDGLLGAAGALVDMKRQVDRVAQEVRTLRAQKEGGYVPPVETRKTRSESVTSTATSATGRRSRAL